MILITSLEKLFERRRQGETKSPLVRRKNQKPQDARATLASFDFGTADELSSKTMVLVLSGLKLLPSSADLRLKKYASPPFWGSFLNPLLGKLKYSSKVVEVECTIAMTFLALIIVIYCVAILALAAMNRSGELSLDDYLVAGRNMGLGLSTVTLFGTWFGAGTLLAAADEVAKEGLFPIAAEPLGAGLALIFAGIFFARPLWRAQLLTLADFFRLRYGRLVEVMFSITVLTYFGWIAAQLVGISGILNVFFGTQFGWDSRNRSRRFIPHWVACGP